MPRTFLTATRLGLATLRLNPLRTTLSTLGIVMGAGSLAAVLALGDGTEQFLRQRVEREGLHVIQVAARTSDQIDGQSLARSEWPSFGNADADALAVVIGRRGDVRLAVEGPGRITTGDPAHPRVARVVAQRVIPATADRLRLARGRTFNEAEMRDGAAVVIVSDKLARALAEQAQPAVGEDLILEGHRRRVVGVLEPQPDRWLVAVVPFGSASSSIVISERRPVPELTVQAARAEDVDSLKRVIEAWAAARPGWGENVRVLASGPQRLRDVRQGILIFKMLMGAFTAISLVVGGIGIMNVLLASVLERTREIGIRKAIGARRRDILVQFLAESIVISGVGSLVGLALGLACAFGATALIRARTEASIFAAITWQTLAVSAASAVIVGVIFGIYPALRASRLAPIDAIHRE
jgi:putative ABC transport system permease protein